MTKRQAIPQLLSRNDVRRFRASSTRFDSILSGMDDKKDLDINTRTALEVGDEIKEPKGFVETAKDFGGGVINFFKDDENTAKDMRDEKIDEVSNEATISQARKEEIIEDLSLPSDFFEFINQKDLVTLPEEEINLSLDVESENEEEGEGGSNVVTIGGEDKQITNNAVDSTTTSNIFVKPTFSDNSKISYILEYGAGAVV